MESSKTLSLTLQNLALPSDQVWGLRLKAHAKLSVWSPNVLFKGEARLYYQLSASNIITS